MLTLKLQPEGPCLILSPACIFNLIGLTLPPSLHSNPDASFQFLGLAEMVTALESLFCHFLCLECSLMKVSLSLKLHLKYEDCPEGIQPCNRRNRDIYLRRYMSPQSRHLGTSHSSPNHPQLPLCIFLNLIHGLKSAPFQRGF